MDRPTILIVEDHEPLRAALRAILETEGYRVWALPNGKEALRAMESRRPDLIVSDVLMPEMNGYDFYRAVRSRQAWMAIPFIFLTVKASREEILKGKSLGVDDYLVKPLDPRELLVTIEAQLGRAHEVQMAAASQFEELKEELVTVLGHELRTPLTYIRCYADLALDEVSAEDRDAETYWAGVRHGADRLTRLAEDVALLAQLGTDRALDNLRESMTVCRDLAGILRVVAQQQEGLATAEGITLEVDIEPDLPPVRLHAQFFVNALGRLVDNAIKFSQGEGKQVTISGRRVGDDVEVAVTDQGVGIPREEIPHLFDRFRQVGREEMEQQGLGLGLAITGKLIEMHDGKVRVESTPGEGSTFAVRLPALQAEPSPSRLLESGSVGAPGEAPRRRV